VRRSKMDSNSKYRVLNNLTTAGCSKTITKGCRHEVSETALGVRIHLAPANRHKPSVLVVGSSLGIEDFWLCLLPRNYQETPMRESSCGLFDFDFITEISKALGKPGRCSFMIQAQKVYGTEFLIGHLVAD